MMVFFIWLLTLVMVLDCIVLIFLVLIQLPKKEAGAGLAFGGSATDALFGAGSGNVLTKITKYAAGIFFALAVFVALLQSHQRGAAGRNFTSALSKAAAKAPATTPIAPEAPVPVGTSAAPIKLESVVPTNSAAALTNAAPTTAPASTNTPAEAPKNP
jgi:preprotein translocase subunit SecG